MPSGSPGSSRTTRGCSLPRDLARRARDAPLTVLAVAVPGGRVQAGVVDDLRAVAPLDVDQPAQNDARARLGQREGERGAPLDEPRADADAGEPGVPARAHEAPCPLGAVEPLQADARPLL